MNRDRLTLILGVFTISFFLAFYGGYPALNALDPQKKISQYSVQVWNIEAGLPGNSVYDIFQTKDGYLWIGTQNGLVRFDGIIFELFNRGNVPQLKDNEIRTIYQAQDDTLWIGTESGGLTRCKEGEFKTYSIKNHKALHHIRAIREDRWGNLWIGSYTEGLTRFSNDRFTTYTTKDGLPDNTVWSIYKDGNQNLWISTYGGIIKLIGPGKFSEEVYAPVRVLPDIKTVCLYEEDTKNFWVGTGKNGLFCLKNKKLFKSGVPHSCIVSLYRDGMKNLWIGAEKGGLTRMNNGVLSTFPGNDGLAVGSVYSIYEDREGSLWVGTLDEGLYQLRNSKFTTYTTKEGLVDDYVHFILESHDGNGLWIGTMDGLSRIEKGELITVLTTKNGLLDNNIGCLFEAPPGTLWIGTSGGLHKFKAGKLTTALTKKDGLSDNRINSILIDRKGDAWIGTEAGLNRLDGNTGKNTVFAEEDGLTNNVIQFLFQNRSGRILVCTEDGLNFFKDGSLTTYRPPEEQRNTSYRCVYEDNDGVIWLGTTNGLMRLQNEETTWYTVKHGLIENHVNCILEDDTGYLWLGGRIGISRIEKKKLEDFDNGTIQELQPHWYNERDGMKSGWCTSQGCKTRDSKLWFPTAKGVTVIAPENIKKNKLVPPPIIEKLLVNDELIDIHSKTRGTKRLELGPGKKRMEFYYTCVSFINPKKIKFKIKLEGEDSDWIDMGNRRIATYTGLSPGTYTFKLTAANAYGEWKQGIVSLSFKLRPTFFQTDWFYLLAALMFLLAGFSAYRLRVRQLRAREKELGKLVQLRTRDLEKRNIQLEKARENIQQSKEIIEEKNQNIMSSISYARRIQQAMLQIKKNMEKELEDYFLIYEPRDIVSGDFYWFDITEDHYLLALADCTGHGVPGALLSMIGYMMLNEVVKVRHILDPAKIIARLHQGFRYILKQEIEETDTYDGMDIGLCRVDLHTGKITFAGARRPLIYVKNSELIEIKGDRKSIGGRQKEKKHSFTNHEIDILDKDKNQDGIMIYLTTDGFADQQNPHNQKYGTLRLKKFLRDHAYLNPTQQKQALLEELKKHRANEEQRDDISIIGLRIRFPSMKPNP
ncbi:MAG: two-component regulator propeller domain-containing protein [Candidatus Aminicenantes bacterium]|jgi:ligand-binding sensor domain-containing protein/serine phosphatase RsbU (regulator of sigma subunit)